MRAASFLSPSLLLVVSMTSFACPAGDDAETGAEGTDAGSTSSADTDAESSGTMDPSADSSGGEEGSTSGGSDLSGEELYLSVCAPCHGNEGEGTMLGYALQHPVREYSTWVVRNGRPPGNPELPGSVMVAYSPESIDDAMLEEIWDYLDSFPQPTTGEGLFLDYCRNCHGEDARGGITGVDIGTEPRSFADSIEKVRQGENAPIDQRGIYMPGHDEARLSDAEVQLIVDHIASM